MAAGMTSTKRFLVRLSLVTGSTTATILGAQSLAMFDRQPDVTSIPQQSVVVPDNTTSTVLQAPPNIVILRHPGQASGSVSSSAQPSQSSVQPIVVQPPQPITIAPPAPVVVNAPVQAVTRSSR